MLTKKEIYLKAYKELEKRRLNRKIKQTKNIQTAFIICPEIKPLFQKINLTSFKIAKTILNNQSNIEKVIEKIRKENESDQKKIEQLLLKNNLSKNFLNPPAFCEKCDDYGTINNERCSCLVSLIKKITSQQLMKDSNLPNVSFSNFSLKYYSNDLEQNKKTSAFHHMSAVLQECKKYAETFNNHSGGLLMHGLTGVGKTHLSLSIAFSVIEQGFTAIYETASELARNIINSRYSNKENDSYISRINSTDLVIIDDLGSEFQSQLNKSAIFEIINLRTSFNRPMIINTNLTPEKLEKNK